MRKFTITIEPHPTILTGLEGNLGIEMNGIQLFKNEEGEYSKEELFYPLRWLIQNFQNYTLEGMPKTMKPAVLLCKKLMKVSEEFWQEGRDKRNRIIGYTFPKKGKEDFDKWMISHMFNYGQAEHPVIFQRRGDQMEISWELPHCYANHFGCEYISLNEFKKEVHRSCSNMLSKITSKNISDFSYWKSFLEELQKMNSDFSQ